MWVEDRSSVGSLGVNAKHAKDYVPKTYDPMNTASVTTAICRELERQPLVPLPPDVPMFEGSGLYAIYYEGESIPLYRPLSSLRIPVYAGQARSHSSATGKGAPSKQPLWRRVREHQRSIVGAGLPIDEFQARFLLLPDVHSDLGEQGLIVNYQPVWNSLLRGFGSHEQGSKTRKSRKSAWDTVHPGRQRSHGEETHDKEQLEARAASHIRKQAEDYEDIPWHQG